jgi:hypothetical protein
MRSFEGLVSGMSARVRRCALAFAAALTGLVCVVSPAVAARHHPTGPYSVFADCPSSDPAVVLCIVVHLTQGELTIGKKTILVNKTMTLQGGMVPSGVVNNFILAPAEGGETLSRTPLDVPGGLRGIDGSSGLTGATTTVELAGAVEIDIESLVVSNGVAIRMPVRAKIENPLLGEGCELGSGTDPLVLSLTDGPTMPPLPNKSIRGEYGHASEVEEVYMQSKTLFVDNAFAAPGASGCRALYSPLVSMDLGVPSPAGHNTAILAARLEVGPVEAVIASE